MTRTSYEIDPSIFQKQFNELKRKSWRNTRQATKVLGVSEAYISSTARNWKISIEKLGTFERVFLEYKMEVKFLLDKK